MINVENLVRDNFPDGSVKKYFSAPLVHWLRWLFHEKEFQKFGRTYKDSRGIEFVRDTLNYFDFQHTVDNTSLANIPRQGRVILVANHPIGSLDGLSLLQLIHSIRPDVKIVANQVLSKLGPLARSFCQSTTWAVIQHACNSRQYRNICKRKALSSSFLQVWSPAGASKASQTAIGDPGFFASRKVAGHPSYPFIYRVDARPSFMPSH